MKNMGKLDSNSTCRNFRQVQKETTQWIAKYMMHKRITGTGQLIRWIKCPRPWDKVDDTFLKKWSYSWFCWLGYSSWRFDGFSCNSLIFSERRTRHSWYLTVLNRQTVKPSCHFSKSGSALVTWPTRYTSPTSSTIEPSSRPSWKTLQTRENLHIFMRPPCIPLATPLGLSCLSLTIRSIRVIRVQKSLSAVSALSARQKYNLWNPWNLCETTKHSFN